MERKQASDFPQELLDLFHEYVHGDIDRRAFFDRAGKFAVGGLTVAGLFEALRPNYAWAQQVAKDDKRIKTEYATVPSPQGNGSIKGYLARPGKSGQVSGRAGRAREPRPQPVRRGRRATPRDVGLHRIRAGWPDVGRRLPGRRRARRTAISKSRPRQR